MTSLNRILLINTLEQCFSTGRSQPTLGLRVLNFGSPKPVFQIVILGKLNFVIVYIVGRQTTNIENHFSRANNIKEEPKLAVKHI